MRNIVQQLRSPTLADDARRNLLGHLGELSQAELQSQIRQRIAGLQKNKDG